MDALTSEPEQIEIQVYRADELPTAKSLRSRFRVVFGTDKTKLQTSVVHDEHGAPVWNTQGRIVLHSSDRVIKFKVLDGDHTFGQVQLPVTQIPRSQADSYPQRVPLQPHKRCANPVGILVYSCYVSKFRGASEVDNNAPRTNRESWAPSRRSATGLLSSLSSSLTNLAFHEHAHARAQSKTLGDSPRVYTKSESRRSEESAHVHSSKPSSADTCDGDAASLHSEAGLRADRALPSGSALSHGSSAYSSGSSQSSRSYLQVSAASTVTTMASSSSTLSASDHERNTRSLGSAQRTPQDQKADPAKRPRVACIDPVEGSVLGDTKLLIRGDNLGDQPTDVQAVYICGSNCTSTLNWLDCKQILVTTKPWRECTGFVIVETRHGRSNSVAQFSFKDYASRCSSSNSHAPALHTEPLCKASDTRPQSASFANPLELTSEICRLRSQVQELQMQNAQLAVDRDRLQQYIDSLTQKVLLRCPEVLCADNGGDKRNSGSIKPEGQLSQSRLRSSSLFSLLKAGQTDPKAARTQTIEQLRCFSSQSSTTNDCNANQLAVPNGSLQPAKSMVLLNETVLL